MKFYNQEDYLKLNKQKNLNLILIIGLSVLFVAVLLVFIFVSNYKTRFIFSLITSLIDFIIVVFLIYFVGKYLYLKRINNEYFTLLESNDEIVKCEVLEVSDFLTTLPDKSRCYEVMVMVEDKQSVYYLSEMFDRESIKTGYCELSVNSDYIKGVKYED